MGYEAHISKLPDILGGARLAFNAVRERYQQFVALLTKTLGAQALDGLCLNTGGSSTYPLYDAGVRVATEIATASAGEAHGFDVEALTHHLPAAFIAAPVQSGCISPKFLKPLCFRACFERWENCPKKDVIFTVVIGWQRLAILRLAQCAVGALQQSKFYELATNSNLQVDDYLFSARNKVKRYFCSSGKLRFMSRAISSIGGPFCNTQAVSAISVATCCALAQRLTLIIIKISLDMIMTFALLLFYLLAPAFLIFMPKVPLLEKLGVVVVSFIVGIAIAAAGLLPEGEAVKVCKTMFRASVLRLRFLCWFFY